MGANRAYILACLERTGSNLLCAALEATRSLGEPDEWLGRSRLHARLSSMGLNDPTSTTEAPRPRDFPEYVRALDTATSRRGVFGVKVHWYQFAAAVAAGWIDDLLDIVPEQARDHTLVIRLRRRNHAAQAVSTLRAQVFGVYVRPIDARAAEPVHHTTPYWAGREEGDDPVSVNAELDRIVRTIEEHEASWDAVLDGLDLPTTTVTYEALASDYQAVAREVIEFVGGRPWPAAGVVPPRTLKQADEVSARLLEEYLAHRRGDAG